MNFLAKLVMLHCVFLAYCLEQNDLDYIGENLKVRFAVIDNFIVNEQDLPRFEARISLTNDGDSPINENSWELYFYYLFMVEPEHLPEQDYEFPGTGLVVSHENGNLYKMVPTDDFAGIDVGETLTFDLIIEFWTVSKSDVMPNWYVTAEGFQPRLIRSTQDGNDFVADFETAKQYKRYDFDQYNPFTAHDRYKRYNYKSEVVEKLIIPTPLQIDVTPDSDLIVINNDWMVECSEDFKKECDYLEEQLSLDSNGNKKITIQPGLVPNIPPGYPTEESYMIEIKRTPMLRYDKKRMSTKLVLQKHQLGQHCFGQDYEDKGNFIVLKCESIMITAPTAAGAFYGVQSLLSLNAGNEGRIQPMIVKDAPRFAYRGMHLDVARNFVEKDEVEKLLNVMAMYKLNHFHFHLTDDEGWRLEMDSFPELTEVGSKRAHDPEETTSIIPQFGSGPTNDTSGTGYYTKAEYQEILRLANDLHITVIPELDFPGHTHAAIKANLVRYHKLLDSEGSEAAESILISDLDDKSKFLSVQYFTDNAVNPCIEGTYNFIRQLVSDLVQLHKDIQELTTFHLGGDEVAEAWTNSSKCEEIFKEGTFPKGPEDLLKYFMQKASTAVINATDTDLTIGVWEDGALDRIDGQDVPYEKDTFAGSEVIAYTWQNIWEWGNAARAYKLANAGYKVVLCPATHLYFDQPQEPDPEERGQYWASRFTDTMKSFSFMPDDLYANMDFERSGKPISEDEFCTSETACPELITSDNILGIQGHLWTETVRRPSHMHYMIFPRMLALAERAWHKSEWEATQSNDGENAAARDKEWANFAATLGSKELARLEERNIEYRISVPGVRVAGVNESIGEVHVLCEFPTMNFVWKAVEDEVWSYPRSCGEKLAIKAEQSLVFRGVSSSGSRFGRSTTVPPYEYDGGASSRIEANLIFTFVISVLSLWLGR